MSHGKHSSGFEWSVVVFAVLVIVWVLSKLANYALGTSK